MTRFKVQRGTDQVRGQGKRQQPERFGIPLILSLSKDSFRHTVNTVPSKH
jgi:hypothetical protein